LYLLDARTVQLLEVLHDIDVEVDHFLVLSHGVDYFGEEVLELHVQLLEFVVIRHVFEELAQKLEVFERVHGGVSFLYQNQNQLPIIIIQIY